MIKLKEINKIINGKLKGDPEYLIYSVNSIKRANQKEISFSTKENIKLEEVNAGALIVKEDSQITYSNLIFVKEPYLAFAKLLEYFFPHKKFNKAISKNAYISKTAHIGKGVTIGIFSYIGDNTTIGDNTEIHSGVKIYNNVKIGKNCIIYSNVVVREDVDIGNNVTIQPGAIIGADGFGFTRLSNGQPVKIPQKGKVIIGNNCEIGANTCVDRSTIEETILKDYVKLDNLVQIGHNTKIGRSTAISALSGISGSVDIGENVIMGGQVGIADHIKIADGVMIAAKSGVSGSIKNKSIIAGIPHQEITKWRKSHVIFRNIEKYIEKIKDLEKKIKELEGK